MVTERVATKPWEQCEDESAEAYEAFLAYRDLGRSRTFKAAAAHVGKHESLIRRWANRHRWRERVWAWDVHEARQDEAAVRQQRDEMLQQHLDDVGRMGRACLLYFRTLVRRDPETQEISFDPRFTPSVALRFLELALKTQGAFGQQTQESQSEQHQQPGKDEIWQLADGELQELIALAKQRAQESQTQEESENDRNQGSTQQGTEEDTAQQDEADEDSQQGPQ